MPSTVLVGAQWGDEGKGKITDLIASDYDYVVRFQGGNNGHTVIHGDKKLALHLMPSGVMYENAVPVIGNGVVVDPGVLVKEMAMLEAEGISCKNLKISNDAHLIMPYHKDLDGADEKSLGDKKIGTTKRGIGPCYQDKMGRKGIRMQDLLDEKIFRLKNWRRRSPRRTHSGEDLRSAHLPRWRRSGDEYLPYARILAPYVRVGPYARTRRWPTGSPSFRRRPGHAARHRPWHLPVRDVFQRCAGGASTGSVGPKAIGRVLGIQKAYVTRVGEGPFPTELKFPENGGTGQDAEDGELLCAAGHEFGVTTGRKRRCGWFDAVIGRYAAEVNGLTDVALTKLDVLSAFDTIKVCVVYECDGVRYDYFPMQQSVLHHAKPIYVELPGWKDEDITGCRTYEELPENTRKYIEYLEEVCGVPMSIISVGPDRDQTIIRMSWLRDRVVKFRSSWQTNGAPTLGDSPPGWNSPLGAFLTARRPLGRASRQLQGTSRNLADVTNDL